MKIGLVLPMGSHSSTPEPYSFIKSFTKRAEDAGFDAVWAFEHVIFRMPGQAERGALEAWTIMALLGEATTRIEIGSLVLGMRFRNPALLAKMAVTLDEAIGGRLTLGVSAGWHDPEYVAFGWPTGHRLGRTEEGFHVLRGLLDGERVTFDGRLVQADDAVLLPPPTRRIPLLITSRMGRMARIAARYADSGTAPGSRARPTRSSSRGWPSSIERARRSGAHRPRSRAPPGSRCGTTTPTCPDRPATARRTSWAIPRAVAASLAAFRGGGLLRGHGLARADERAIARPSGRSRGVRASR